MNLKLSESFVEKNGRNVKVSIGRKQSSYLFTSLQSGLVSQIASVCETECNSGFTLSVWLKIKEPSKNYNILRNDANGFQLK